MIMEPHHAFVRKIFSHTAPSYDCMVALTTMGQDTSWKRKMITIVQTHECPRSILDMACGTGILTYLLAKTFPESHITAIDLQEEYIQQAEEKKSNLGIDNVSFHVMSAESVCEGAYDIITASYLPKYVNMEVIISTCADILNPGGILIFHDFIYPENFLFKMLYNGYWILLKPLLWLHRDWREMSRELRSYIVQTHWIKDIHRALRSNQFEDITVEIQKFQIAAIVSARKK